jgi:GMP synthase (glutamine-hydrolysing)
MKKAIAIRHVAFEDLGSWESLIEKTYKIHYVDAAKHGLSSLTDESIDLLIVLGGPIGVYQEKEYPFIKEEISLLQKRLSLDLPTLGICLGSQLMARALGASVYPNHCKEIGWQPLRLTEKGESSFIKHLGANYTSMFHWHGDTFDLPKAAVLLASTANCQNQVFSYGKNGLAFQCHPEVTAERLEQWWIGHAAELSQNGLSVTHLRKQSAELSSQLEEQSAKCLQGWLNLLT